MSVLSRLPLWLEDGRRLTSTTFENDFKLSLAIFNPSFSLEVLSECGVTHSPTVQIRDSWPCSLTSIMKEIWIVKVSKLDCWYKTVIKSQNNIRPSLLAMLWNEIQILLSTSTHVSELSVRDLPRVMIYTDIKILAHYSARIKHPATLKLRFRGPWIDKTSWYKSSPKKQLWEN